MRSVEKSYKIISSQTSENALFILRVSINKITTAYFNGGQVGNLRKFFNGVPYVEIPRS